jgi:hypothetical protein
LEKTQKWQKKEEEQPQFTQLPISPIHSSSVFDFSLHTSLAKAPESEEYLDFLEKLEKEILLPLRMPGFFPEASRNTKVVRVKKEHSEELRAYLEDNGFARRECA